jgi:predicted GNAT family acetyltransferase
VPSEARGRGAASEITSFALDYARAHGYRVRPSCPFVARFVAVHPEFADLVESSS